MGYQAQIKRAHALFKFTRDAVHLSDWQRKFYEANGYLVVRNLVDHGLLNQCKQRFLDICEKRVDAGTVMVVKDFSLKNKKNVTGERLVSKIQTLTFDDTFCKYIEFSPLVNIVQSVIGPNITAFHAMVFNKPPSADANASRHPMHQDMYYFPMRPAESIVSTWTAMERVDDQNGCLFVIPGSHKGQLHPHEYPENVKNIGYHEVVGFRNVPTVNLVMEKGDTVVFHPLLLHGSGPNFTKGFRKAISCNYADTNCQFVDVRGTMQAKVAEEFVEIAQKHGYPKVDYKNFWKYTSKRIRGPVGNFQNIDGDD